MMARLDWNGVEAAEDFIKTSIAPQGIEKQRVGFDRRVSQVSIRGRSCSISPALATPFWPIMRIMKRADLLVLPKSQSIAPPPASGAGGQRSDHGSQKAIISLSPLQENLVGHGSILCNSSFRIEILRSRTFSRH